MNNKRKYWQMTMIVRVNESLDLLDQFTCDTLNGLYEHYYRAYDEGDTAVGAVSYIEEEILEDGFIDRHEMVMFSQIEESKFSWPHPGFAKGGK